MKIAYIMSRFPHLPETFILREMNELEIMGCQITIYPLICQEQVVVHPEAQHWLIRTQCSPYFSFDVIKANINTFIQKPLLYSKLLMITIVENLSSPSFLFRGLLLFPKAVLFARKMAEDDIRHIHAHYASHPAFVAWIIHCLTGISYSITVHAHDIFARTPMLTTKLWEATFIIAISEYNREHIAHIVGPWVREKTHVIHCGILPEKYLPKHEAHHPGLLLKIISVGSLKPIKGQKYLVEACKILKERGISFHCQIIGDGPEYPDIRNRISGYQLDDMVTLLGAKTEEEVAEILSTAHCYVQPSIGEGLPLAVMEAYATELPVVATAYSGVTNTINPGEKGYPIKPSEVKELMKGLSRIYQDTKDAGQVACGMANRLVSRTGIHELVISGKTGYLVPPADPKALADAITAVYEDSEKSTRMALAGKEIVLREFNLRINAKKIISLFDNLDKTNKKRK
jgi:glycosyltransferase involved in cell wall biosynthesis